MKLTTDTRSRLAFLEQVTDRALRREIARVLLSLQTLSDVAAARIGMSSPSAERHPGPPQVQSLYDRYLTDFEGKVEGNRPIKEFWNLVWEAENDYKRHVEPGSADERLGRVGMVYNRADEDGLRAHVLDHYEGENSFKVALRLSLSEGWIQSIRQQANREPEWGHPRIDWRKASNEQKVSLIAGMAASATQQQVAETLGLSVRTVATYWPRRVAA